MVRGRGEGAPPAACLRLWPAVWVGAFLATTDVGTSLVKAAGVAIGNTREGVLAAVFIRHLHADVPTFHCVRQVLARVAAAALMPAAATVRGTLALCLGGVAPWATAWMVVKTWRLDDSALPHRQDGA